MGEGTKCQAKKNLAVVDMEVGIVVSSFSEGALPQFA